jgi:hypothetical protein
MDAVAWMVKFAFVWGVVYQGEENAVVLQMEIETNSKENKCLERAVELSIDRRLHSQLATTHS